MRAINLYGDPSPWQVSDRGPLFTALSFLNATKYPASLVFVVMTLGPALLLLPYLEGFKGKLSHVARTFGRVPLFFYVAHIPFIHVCAMAYSKLRYGFIGPEGSWVGWYIQGQQFAPEGYEQNLWLVWGVWLGVTIALYWPCKWFAGVKNKSANPILKYL